MESTDPSAPASPTSRPDGAWCVLLALLLISCTWLIAIQPLFVGDTDIWYHLNGGRFISTNGALPDGSFFSFLEPYRTFTDYYWLFQLLVYKVHSFGGVYALLFLRWLLYVTYIFTAWKILGEWVGGRGVKGFGISAYLLLAAILIAGMRLTNLRPHCFSSLAALGFIYILERKRDKAWLLPLIALLWVNFHGITYPVLWVIALSYIAPLVLRRLREGELDRASLTIAICLTLSMAMVWATPNGGDLLMVPFKFSKYSNEYIRELVRLDLSDFLSPSFLLLMPKGLTAFSLYFALVIVALALSLKRGRLASAHFFLFLGAFFLLTRATRFTMEFSILCMPLAALAPRELISRREGGGFGRLAVAALLSAPIFFQAYYMPPHTGYAAPAQLPTGNVEFLKKVGTGGKVLNHPNTGGFLQWELGPKYKIFMDMQIPFLFEDEDMLLTLEVTTQKSAFDGFIRKYQPEYVSALYKEGLLLDRVAEQSDYALVFFDDVGALFANRKLLPALVEQYEVKETPLIKQQGKSFKALSEGKDKVKIKAELTRILSIWPKSGMVNLWLAQAAMSEEDYESALKYAMALDDGYSNTVQVKAQKGDALRKLGRHEEALEVYASAMRYAEGSSRNALKRGMAYTYKAMGDPEKAYEYFTEGVKVLEPNTTAEDLWQFSMSAYLSGHVAEGVELARFAELRAGAGDAEPGPAIRKFLKEVEVQPIQGGLK